MRKLPCILIAAASTAAVHAQATDDTAAREFRDRVVQLALIYRESSGIDLAGDKVQAREVRKVDERCGDVEVVTLRAGQEIRREVVRACKAH